MDCKALADTEAQIWACEMAGNDEVTLNGIAFVDDEGNNLITTPSRCSAAQHKAAEIAGLPVDHFGCCAGNTRKKMQGAGQEVTGLYPGVLMFFGPVGAICSTCGEDEGHVVCYGGVNEDGVQVVYENTCADRGEGQAFKRTPLADVDAYGTDASKHLCNCSLTA